ncbi:MAG: hypothetical protein ACXAC2_14695 [Candidatus Kariarchaeaceae archaeon]|jgi:hypothetical protein
MELVIYCDSPPPEKRSWASSQFSDRKEWSWISELVTTWFCYSNGIRKELNLSIIVNDIQVSLYRNIRILPFSKNHGLICKDLILPRTKMSQASQQV